jgi:hypothetical protein
MLKIDACEYKERYEAGRNRMNNLLTLWQSLLFYFLPNSEHLIWSNKTDKGEYKAPADDTGIHAASIMAGGIYANTVSRGSRIADLLLEDQELNKDDDVQEYLSKQITIATQLIQASNYPSAMYDCLRHYAVLGTDLLFSYYDEGLRRINFRNYRVFDCWIEANAAGRIDTVMRKENVPHRVAKERWGDKIPQFVKDALLDPQTAIDSADYIHIVEPNPDYIPEEGATDANLTKSAMSKHYKYRQIWIYPDEDIVVESGKGYRTFPYHIARTGVLVNQLPFGRSPAMDALPTMRELHRAMQWWRDATETALAPPNLLPKGSIDPDDWDQRPRARNVYNVIEGNKPEPMMTSISLEPMWQSILDSRGVVEDFFWVPQFRALDQISGSNPTATEVQEAAKQGIQGIAPLIGTLEPEVYSTIVERVLDLMDLHGLSAEKPEIMRDKKIVINMITQLDAELQSSDIRRTMVSLGQCFEIMKQFRENPEMGNLVDRDRIIRNTLYVNNVDPEAVFSTTEAEKRAKKLAAEQQKQAMMQMAMDKIAPADPLRTPEAGSIAEGGMLAQPQP